MLIVLCVSTQPTDHDYIILRRLPRHLALDLSIHVLSMLNTRGQDEILKPGTDSQRFDRLEAYQSKTISNL